MVQAADGQSVVVLGVRERVRDQGSKSNPDVRFESCNGCAVDGKLRTGAVSVVHCNAGEGGFEW